MSDLREARERLRRLKDAKDTQDEYAVYRDVPVRRLGGLDWQHMKALQDADRALLADNDLAENPADSELAVTEEWLESVGFTWADGGLGVGVPHPDGGRLCVVRQIGRPSAWVWRDADGDAAELPDLPTRGHVRRMLRALGIESKEPPTQGV